MDDTTHLLLAAGKGDVASFTAFVRATQGDVWRFCAHLVDTQAADDLTQDVYVRVAKSMHGFRGEAAARTWLMTIARRVCADHLRGVVRRRRHERITDPVTMASMPTVHHDEGPATDLDRLLARLQPDRREAMVLTQVLGMTYAEAADAAGVPVGTIRSRVARARAELVATMPAANAGGSATDAITNEAAHPDPGRQRRHERHPRRRGA